MYDSYKTVKVYSIVEEEVPVPVYQGHLEWYKLDQPVRLDAPFEATGRVCREPIYTFCERFCKTPWHHPDYPHRDFIESLWETKETFVAFKHSDKDGFMKYLTLLVDEARNERQRKIESLEKQLYHTQVNLEYLDEKISKATFWGRLKYLFGGEL